LTDDGGGGSSEEEDAGVRAAAPPACGDGHHALGTPAWAAAEGGREWAVTVTSTCLGGGGAGRGGGGARLFASARAGEGTRLATVVDY